MDVGAAAQVQADREVFFFALSSALLEDERIFYAEKPIVGNPCLGKEGETLVVCVFPQNVLFFIFW